MSYPYRSDTPGDTPIPAPYCHRIDRPALHRPEGESMMSYGHSDGAPDQMRTLHQVARYLAARTRVEHSYYGPMTVRVWADRGPDEHYRNDPPTSAYCLVLDHDLAEENPK